ncbi:MAG: hypothetical protein M1832_000525 [Thelocarpon impressellum]|nr:MAG: hypothetical protein M1832_000525 [Thelocarpon impressellum]
MSATTFLRLARPAAGPPRRTPLPPASRLLSSTPSRSELKESDRAAKDSPDVSSHYEQHKQDQLAKQKEGKGHWKAELASDSETAIKADRGENGSTQEDIGKLQKETAEFSKKEQK